MESGLKVKVNNKISYLANGMYDRPYHVIARNCRTQNRIARTAIFHWFTHHNTTEQWLTMYVIKNDKITHISFCI